MLESMEKWPICRWVPVIIDDKFVLLLLNVISFNAYC